MENWGVYNAAYMAAYDSVISQPALTGTALFKEIMTQKYLALYFQVESYNDWRRTENVIGLAPNPISTVAKSEIPRRYPYPLDEVTYNQQTPAIANIWQRVWWDVLSK